MAFTSIGDFSSNVCLAENTITQNTHHLYSLSDMSHQIFFLRLYLFFRERGREGKRQGEKHQCVVASHVACHWGPGLVAGNPGMCPDWELNQQPCGSEAGAQSTEPHQPGLNHQILHARVPLEEDTIDKGS